MDLDIVVLEMFFKIKNLSVVIPPKSSLTHDNLLKRDWNGPPWCILCKSEVETVDQIFFNCSFSK